MSDLALVRRVLAGDEAAFEEFFAACFPPLYRFALARLSGDEDTAEEIVQRAAAPDVATLFLLITCRRDMAPAQFAAYRRDVLGPRIAGSVPMAGYTQNFPAIPAVPGGLAVDGIDEISVADAGGLDLRALGAALTGIELAELAGLWTRQVELYSAA